MDVDVYMGMKIEMNYICLGCGDDMFANVVLCKECWNGENI